MGRGMRAGKPQRVAKQQPNMAQLQKLQEEMEAAQAEVAAQEFSATAGGGAVEVTVTGGKKLTAINIDEELLGEEADKEMLEEMLVGACNEALEKAEEASESVMAGLTGGMGLPG